MENAIATTQNAAIQSVEYNPIEGFVNTFDLTTDEGKLSTLAALNNTVSLNDHVGEVLQICNVITEPGIRRGRNGAPDSQCQNTYLVDTDGVSYFTQSDGVAKTLRPIVTLFPDLRKSSAGYLPIACIETQLSNGNTMKTLVPKIG